MSEQDPIEQIAEEYLDRLHADGKEPDEEGCLLRVMQGDREKLKQRLAFVRMMWRAHE